MLHGNKCQEMHQVHDPRGFGMTRVNDSNNTLDFTPGLKTFAGKVGVPQCAGKKNREKFWPFNTYPFGLEWVNEGATCPGNICH